MINGNTVYCDCCGTEKLAEVVGDNLVIKDRRHGEKHVVSIPVEALLDKFKNNGHNIDN
jgi:hypothetical protein